MGGCCFTPRKTQLLWWYWLVLFSVVGVPMFAAALYVQRASSRGILDRRDVRRASCLFWHISQYGFDLQTRLFRLLWGGGGT